MQRMHPNGYQRAKDSWQSPAGIWGEAEAWPIPTGEAGMASRLCPPHSCMGDKEEMGKGG